jgi:hypothetical protein
MSSDDFRNLARPPGWRKRFLQTDRIGFNTAGHSLAGLLKVMRMYFTAIQPAIK